jgi:predicted acyl esterase
MHGQFRASHRARRTAPYDSFGLPWHSHASADATPLAASTPAEIEFEMLPMSYIFKAGHRLRLVLFFADASAPTSPDATMSVTVFRAPAMPSSVTLPIIPSASGTGQLKSLR